MTYKEQKETIEDLQLLMELYSKPEAIALPCPNFSQWESLTRWDWDDEACKYNVNYEKSKKRMKKVAKFLGNVEKKFTDNRLEIFAKLGHNLRLTFNVDRAAYCKRVPTGETRTIPATEERTEPIYEWICDDPSILR